MRPVVYSRCRILNFNPRTCTRCDWDFLGDRLDRRISIHAPARGAIDRQTDDRGDWRHFNPRTCTRCDVVGTIRVRNRMKFQSTHLHEVRSHDDAEALYGQLFQSTHLHEVRYVSLEAIAGMLEISIHAPARGAMGRHHVLVQPHGDFNPRTCTRCDITSSPPKCPSSHFNPRTCTRCDGTGFDGVPERHISIHAPARGAINAGYSLERPERISIHAPARGAIHACSYAGMLVSFQSTHLHEVRWMESCFGTATRRFQSTHLHEVRCAGKTVAMVEYLISIHAPARGAIFFSGRQPRYGYISIHAPARGAMIVNTFIVDRFKFQSTHLHEVRFR